MKSPLVKAVFVLSLLWWAYLFYVTQIVVVFDSESYETLGRLIAHHGFAPYLQGGPQREPLFPLIIAVSMRLGEWLGISYYYPLKLIGIIFLLLTMVFSCRLMEMLKIRPWIMALTLLYMGFSPVMTNSSMRLWSEFAAYPWIVLAVIWSARSWDAVDEDGASNARVAWHGAMVALMFLLIMFVKAVAEGVILFYLWPFYVRIFSYLKADNFVKARKTALFCLTTLLIFEGVVNIYNGCNYYYNGHFAFTNRGDWAFWSNTARRMEPLTPQRLGAALAVVTGSDICERFFTQEDCDFWSARHSDDIMVAKQQEQARDKLPPAQADRFPLADAARLILSNPLQEVVLMAVEAHKMFFWEDSVAFVAYPDWLERIFYCPLFLNVTKTLLGILSWLGCLGAVVYLFRRRRGPVAGETAALLFTFNLIFWYMVMYSLFFVLDRYAYPLISLYLILIAFNVKMMKGPVR